MAFLKVEYCLLILSLFFLVQGQLILISEKQVREIGDQVDLNCTVTDEFETIVWKKFHERTPWEPLANDDGLITKDSRFSSQFIAVDDTTTTLMLSIKDIQDSDATRYQCQVLTETQNFKAEVELEVRQPDVNNSSVVVKDSKTSYDERIEATLARIEKTLARIEALEGTKGLKNNLKMDAKSEATLARIETTLVRIEATLVRIEANQIEFQKHH